MWINNNWVNNYNLPSVSSGSATLDWLVDSTNLESKILPPNLESSKEQNLNLLYASNYINTDTSIYIIFIVFNTAYTLY